MNIRGKAAWDEWWVLPASLSLAASVFLVGCGKKEAAAPAAQAPEVSVLTVKAQTVPVTFQFVGQTESSQQVEIRARVNGFLEKRVYTEGSFVQPGQVLFRMDRKPFEADLQAAKGELAQQQARLTTARANLNRVKPLVADNALAAKDLDDATGQEQAAAAAVEAAKAKVAESTLNLGYTTIESPLAGLSSFAKVQDGAYVSAANSLLTYVARLDPMRVNFSLSENESLRLREEIAKGQLHAAPRDDYEVELVLADGSVFPAHGRITFADASFSQETGTFLLRAELPNPKGTLRPGQFVRVNVLGFARPNSIVVPQRAVQQGPRGAFVWIIDKDNKAQLRPVEAGDWMGDQWLVGGGLKDGDRVVVDGFLRLAPGVPAKTKDVPAEPLPQRAAAGTSAAGAGVPGTPAGTVGAAAPAATAQASGAPAAGAQASAVGGGTTVAAAPGAATAAPASAPPAGAAAGARNAVYFEPNRAKVDATGQARLTEIAAEIRKQPTARAAVQGYVDASGSAARNKTLARQRAEAVRDVLVAAGVPAANITLEKPSNIVGGESAAMARRVDVVLAGAR
ncbi:efflux RND transporter periplasmic adaptor subunit [Variovorax sp. OV329]|uniref:efflux RND transporter periplasmic adaptor subunit n=1 Tax=Variovorax sp. OV329 TaxID=1882825 RepID=UPI0008F28682|nr:efflux RND transporter periplasmic adaptor subunit [Variovorax sp. OV329]SFM87856.1 membrane fusion protein, multidrug efflux system [Variovorax sp. OV329]